MTHHHFEQQMHRDGRSDLDGTLEYRFWRSHTHGRCRVRIWVPPKIVVVTELEDNPGPSITNACETIANTIEHTWRATAFGPGGFTYIEHYHHPSNTDLFNQVTFARNDRGWLHTPTWQPITQPPVTLE